MTSREEGREAVIFCWFLLVIVGSADLHEKTQTEKKNFHVVNAFTLLLARLELWRQMPKDPKPSRLAPSYMSA
jgi:hypothetical protein